MKKRLIAIIATVLFSLSLIACNSKINIDKKFDELGITQASEVTNCTLYETKTELFTNEGVTLETVGYEHIYTAFYVFDTLDDIKAGHAAYADYLRGQGYNEVATNFSSERYVVLENDKYSITVDYDDVSYNWKGAEGKYILNVTVDYN